MYIGPLVFLAAVGWLAALHFWAINRLHVQACERAIVSARDGTWKQTTTDLAAAATSLDEAKRALMTSTAVQHEQHAREQFLVSLIHQLRAETDRPVTLFDRRN